jgi:hypothetical protein
MCEYQFFESIIEKIYYNEKETKFEFTMTSNHPNVVTREIESGCWDIRKKISLIVFDALSVEFDVRQVPSLIFGCTGATERTGWIHRRDSLKVVGIGGRRYCSRVNIALLQISKIRCLLTHSIHF